MEYPQPPAKGPISRINWTQTTTITLAAFVGCLAALAILYFLFKSRLGDSVRLKMTRLDQLDKQIDELQDEYNYKLQRSVPITGKRTSPPVVNPKADGQKEEQDDKEATGDQDKEPKGPAVETTPAF